MVGTHFGGGGIQIGEGRKDWGGRGGVWGDYFIVITYYPKNASRVANEF